MTESIVEAATTTATAIPDHYATLLGERPAGSTWGREFTEDDWFLPWAEVKVEGPVAMTGCRYFRLAGRAFHEAFPNATVGAVPLNEIQPCYLEYLERHQGEHGPELRFPAKVLGHDKNVKAHEAWVILGQHEGQEVVFTAHPGQLLMPCPKDGSEPCPKDPVAVKLVD